MRAMLFVSLVAVLGLACSGGDGSSERPAQTSYPVTASFVQYDYEGLAGYEGRDTPHGAISLEFDAPPGVLFANAVLEIDGRPHAVAENVVVITCGGPRRLYVAIDLRPLQEWQGQDVVSSVRHACSLTTLPRQGPPEGFEDARVASRTVRFLPGLFEASGLPALRASPRRPDGRITLPTYEWDADYACHSSYPNQECGPGECAPAAVSNGMIFLGVAPGQNGIRDCWELTDFDGSGSPMIWPYRKRQRTPLAPWAVETEILDVQLGSAVTRTEDFRAVIQAIRDGRAVELSDSIHVVSVVAAAEIFAPGGSIYALHVAHDVLQGEPGGAVIEATFYDPETNALSGGTPGLIDGAYLLHYTIQAPIGP